jgi:hypothetical protein
MERNKQQYQFEAPVGYDICEQLIEKFRGRDCEIRIGGELSIIRHLLHYTRREDGKFSTELYLDEDKHQKILFQFELIEEKVFEKLGAREVEAISELEDRADQLLNGTTLGKV